MSIRKKVALYYTFVTVLFAIMVMSAVMIGSGYRSQNMAKNNVTDAVQEAFEEIEYSAGIIQIDNDFDQYMKGVILLVYSDDGQLLKGRVPDGFPVQTPLISGNYEEVTNGDEQWLVYDLMYDYPSGQGIIVRGIYNMNTAVKAINSILFMTAVILPLLIVISMIVGWRITGRAFKPFDKIRCAAAEINEGSDLSKRLPCGKNKDELYLLAETLNSMIERLDKAFRSEKEFTSDAAHELKTPLAVMLSECEVLLQGEHTEKEYRDGLAAIESRCRKTYNMVQQLLQLSRTFDKKGMLEMEVVNLSLVCEATMETMTAIAEEKNVKLYSEIEPDIEIEGDETLIVRMLMNMIGNGIKYRDMEKEPYVKLSLRKEDVTVLSVSDNGIGIAEENVDKVFDKFFMVNKSRNRKDEDDESYGLGLSMVKWIAEAHGATIKAESTYGKGSCFTVRFEKKR